MVAVRTLVFLAAVATVASTALSEIHTFVLPRAAPVRLSRAVFLAVRVFIVRLSHLRRHEGGRDDTLALFAPVSLLILPIVWLAIIGTAYTAMYWAVEQQGWRHAIAESGSSMFTLGFTRPGSLPTMFMAFSEAAFGIASLALLITYLPSMYAAFARREAQVALLVSRAAGVNQPPWAPTMIIRFHNIGAFDQLDDLWVSWEGWFVDIEESHLSLAALPFYRSPVPGRSWVTAAGTVLDSVALMESAVDTPNSPRAQLCIRAGFLALRRIADFFSIAYDPDPAQGDATSITRAEFDEALEVMAAAGVPLRRDRDQAWRDFNGWRVNYDAALLGLATVTLAPAAPWSSDRMPAYRRLPVSRRARARRGNSPQ